MTSETPVHQPHDLDWLLENLVERVPHTRSALLLSSDGLKKAAAGLDAADDDHLAALASGLFSLARSAGERFGGSPGVRQAVVELDPGPVRGPGRQGRHPVPRRRPGHHDRPAHRPGAGGLPDHQPPRPVHRHRPSRPPSRPVGRSPRGDHRRGRPAPNSPHDR